MHIAIFDLYHVKIIWGYLVHFPQNWSVIRKPLIEEQSE